MSFLQYPVLQVSQWGSGSMQELTGGTSSPAATMSLITPGTAPAGRVLGTYSCQVSLSSQTMSWSSYQVTQATPANGYSFGYYWRPKTNPSLGNVPLPYPDTSLNGRQLMWQSSDKKLALWNSLGTSLIGSTNAVADSTEVFHSVTNPWYWIAYAKKQAVGVLVYIYKHNGGTSGNISDFDLIDLYQDSSAFGQAITYRILNSNNATGAYEWTNIYTQDGVGGNPPMPIGPNMITGAVTGKSANGTQIIKGNFTSGTVASGTSSGTSSADMTDGTAPFTASALIGYTVTTNGKTGYITANTTSVLTVASWVGGTPTSGLAYTVAADDVRTGTSESEAPYVAEIPPVDTSASYLQQTALFAGSSQQYTFTQNLVTGKNVLGLTVFQRTQSSSTSNTIQTFFGASGSPSRAYPSTATWLYDENYASSYSSGTTPFTPTDIDNGTIGHRDVRGAGTIFISQMLITVAYGNDDTPVIGTIKYITSSPPWSK